MEASPSFQKTIRTTQLFSRRGLGYLWDRRDELDPGQVALLTTLYNNKTKGLIECQQLVEYKLSNKKAGKLGWGRLYGTKGSLEQLEKEVRGTLCKDFYHDLDIKNCHFVLLTQFAKRVYGVDMPEVDKYIANREQFLADVGGSREDAKTEVIKIMYGAANTTPSLAPLAKETREFSKMLSIRQEYEELFAECKKNPDTTFGAGKKQTKVKSVYGSFLSYILQNEERSCMLAMRDYLQQKEDKKVDVLCYDGVMVRKEAYSNEELPASTLRGAEAWVKETTHYDTEIIVKPFSFYEIPKTTEELCPGVTKEAYDDMKNRFEMNNFYYMPSNELVEVYGREMTRMTLDHAREYYSAKWRFTHSTKFADYTPFFDIWRKDETRRIIRTIDMKASDDPTVFVMAPSFAWSDDVEPAAAAVEKFQDLVRLFGGEAQQKYIINWMAQLVQKPFETTDTSLVITGVKGCGKDTLFDFFMEFVIGTSYSANYGCGGTQFFNTHDTGRMNKFICKVEEANKETFRKNADKFKSLVTSKTEIFNGKNQKPVTVANYNRFILTSNSGCPVDMSDGERRFVVASCSSKNKGNHSYWADIRASLFNKAAGVAVGQWLNTVDISGFNFREIPADEFQNAIVDSVKTSEEFFVEDWDGEEASIEGFFNLYRAFCIEKNLPHAQNTISLGKRLLPLLRDGKLKRVHKREGNFYTR
jgi:hypothetical protein